MLVRQDLKSISTISLSVFSGIGEFFSMVFSLCSLSGGGVGGFQVGEEGGPLSHVSSLFRAQIELRDERVDGDGFGVLDRIVMRDAALLVGSERDPAEACDLRDRG